MAGIVSQWGVKIRKIAQAQEKPPIWDNPTNRRFSLNLALQFYFVETTTWL